MLVRENDRSTSGSPFWRTFELWLKIPGSVREKLGADFGFRDESGRLAVYGVEGAAIDLAMLCANS